MSTILEEIIKRKGNFIILITSLDTQLLIKLIDELKKDLKFTYLQFTQLGLEYDSNIIKKRIDDFQDTCILIYGLYFPLDIKCDCHINLSINHHRFEEVKEENKYENEFYQKYLDKSKESSITKYINIKPDTDIKILGDLVFEYISNRINYLLKK